MPVPWALQNTESGRVRQGIIYLESIKTLWQPEERMRSNPMAENLEWTYVWNTMVPQAHSHR